MTRRRSSFGKGTRRFKLVSKSTMLLVILLCLLCINNALIGSGLPVEDQQDILVTVESPTNTEYAIGQIIPIRLLAKYANDSAVENAIVDVSTNWDDQIVHVPYLEDASYAPDPNYTLPKGQISDEDLIELNNNGFLRLPSSEGDWTIFLQVKPPSPSFFPYYGAITIHVSEPGQLFILYVLAIGWVSVAIFIVILIKKRKK